jgi:hypothetical protein
MTFQGVLAAGLAGKCPAPVPLTPLSDRATLIAMIGIRPFGARFGGFRWAEQSPVDTGTSQQPTDAPVGRRTFNSLYTDPQTKELASKESPLAAGGSIQKS